LIYIHTNYKAPNFRLVKINISNVETDYWTDLIPENDNVLSVSKAGGYFFTSYMVDVKSEVFQYDYAGKLIRQIELPSLGTAKRFTADDGQKEL